MSRHEKVWLEGLRRGLRRAVDDLELLLEGRLLLFLIGAFLALTWGIFGALLSGGGGKFDQVYFVGVLLPTLPMLCLALSSLVALERRAGSLDLALAAPNPVHYFLRRVWPPLVLFFIQGSLVLLITYLERHRLSDLLAGEFRHQGMLARALVAYLLVVLTTAAINLFWASRLRSGGAVLVADLLSLAFLSPFIFRSPALGPGRQNPAHLLDVYHPELVWLWPQFVLLISALLFFFAGLHRLRRPEALS